jgi:hypothetical protein
LNNVCFARVGGSIKNFRDNFSTPKSLVEKSPILVTRDPERGNFLYQFNSITGKFTLLILANEKNRISKQKLSLPVKDKIDDRFLFDFIKESVHRNDSDVSKIVDFIKHCWQENLLPSEKYFFGYKVSVYSFEAEFGTIEISR